jgi:hypothetical protein
MLRSLVTFAAAAAFVAALVAPSQSRAQDSAGTPIPTTEQTYRCTLGDHWVGVTITPATMTMSVDQERWYGEFVVGRNLVNGRAQRYEDENIVVFEMPSDTSSNGFNYLLFPKLFDQVMFQFCWGCMPYICSHT